MPTMTHTVRRTIDVISRGAFRHHPARKLYAATYRCDCGCLAGKSPVAYERMDDLDRRDVVPVCPIVYVRRWRERNPLATEESAVVCLAVEADVVRRAFSEAE